MNRLGAFVASISLFIPGLAGAATGVGAIERYHEPSDGEETER